MDAIATTDASADDTIEPVVEVASVDGTREIPIADVLLGYRKIDLKPNELITAVTCAVLPEGAREGWRKLGPRAAEAYVTGKPLTEETLAEAERIASASITPISDIRSTADYRTWVAGRMVRGFLLQSGSALYL